VGKKFKIIKYDIR